jgi:hypothetical protein
MQILYDLQQEIENLDFNSSEFIVPVGDFPPTLSICEVDDVKTILVNERTEQVAGLGFFLPALHLLRPGDRITVTGRVPRDSPTGSWGVALCVEETETRKAEECQLAQFTSPKSLFALSHILCKSDLNGLLGVQTTRWGAINPTMDFFVDSILITRDENSYIAEDERETVYSFETDENLVVGGAIASGSIVDSADYIFTSMLAESGNPTVKVFEHENKKAIYINERNKDWDAIDINLLNLKLLAGNKYEVTVCGKMDGTVPEGSIITFQGVPGYSWRNNQNIESNQRFTLSHVLTHADVKQWETLRITTNAAGATVPFYIYNIEIKRLGLL